MKTLLGALVVSCSVLACGGPTAAAPPSAPVRAAPTAAPAPEPPKPPAGALWRDDVNRAVDGGVGKFMQRVDVEQSLDQGMFQGWRIVNLHPDQYWQGVDLHPGDIVLHVNGMPLETPFDAYDAMQSLKTADHLSIQYLRGGQQRELSYRIVAKPGTPTASSAPAASAPH